MVVAFLAASAHHWRCPLGDRTQAGMTWRGCPRIPRSPARIDPRRYRRSFCSRVPGGIQLAIAAFAPGLEAARLRWSSRPCWGSAGGLLRILAQVECPFAPGMPGGDCVGTTRRSSNIAPSAHQLAGGRLSRLGPCARSGWKGSSRTPDLGPSLACAFIRPEWAAHGPGR
jgi:hypothetical protein